MAGGGGGGGVGEERRDGDVKGDEQRHKHAEELAHVEPEHLEHDSYEDRELGERLVPMRRVPAVISKPRRDTEYTAISTYSSCTSEIQPQKEEMERLARTTGWEKVETE